jgi:hypothetical protein
MEIIPLASGLIDTAITVGARIAGGFRIDEVQKFSYNNFAPHFVDSGMAEDATVQKWEVSAAWFTHASLSYWIAKSMGPVATGEDLVRGATEAGVEAREENQQNVQESKIISSKFPYVITFDVVSYMPRDRRRNIAESISSAHRGVDAYSASLKESIELLKAKKDRTTSSSKKAAIEKEIEHREKVFLEYTKALSDITEDMLFEIAKSKKMRHNICNFRVSPAPRAGVIRRGLSAGIIVESSLSGGADWDGDVFVELKWQETILGKVYNWGGQLRFGLDKDGVPSVTGKGEFYERFSATHTGLKIRQDANPQHAINREARREARHAAKLAQHRADQTVKSRNEPVAGTSDVRKRAPKDFEILRDPDRSPGHDGSHRHRDNADHAGHSSERKHRAARPSLRESLAEVVEMLDAANNDTLHKTDEGKSQSIWWLPDSEYVLIGKDNAIYKRFQAEGIRLTRLHRGTVTVLKHGFRGKIEVQLTAERGQVRKALRRATTKTVVWK